VGKHRQDAGATRKGPHPEGERVRQVQGVAQPRSGSPPTQDGDIRWVSRQTGLNPPYEIRNHPKEVVYDGEIGSVRRNAGADS